MDSTTHLKQAGPLQVIRIIKRSCGGGSHHENSVVAHEEHVLVAELGRRAGALVVVLTQTTVLLVIRDAVVEQAGILMVHPEPRVL